jgi:pectate lyase
MANYPTWTRNVIVRNLVIDTPWDVNPEDADNAYADGLTVSRAQNIYLDHLTISDGDTPDSLATGTYDTRHDGALDVVRGSATSPSPIATSASILRLRWLAMVIQGVRVE